MKLNEKETCTVLAALRHYQENVSEQERFNHSAHFIDTEVLSNSEIDELCERFNFDNDEVFHACPKKKSTKDAEETIKLIKEDIYSTSRPDNIIIKELIEVIGYLAEKIERLERKENHHI